MIRLFDIIFSLLALLFLFPIFLVISILLLCTGEHYIIFLQKRVGRGGKIFNVFKFATMLKESPNLPGGLLTRDHDPRVLPLGGILRKTKLNELPQLVNILLGSMSFVGPRPQAPEHYALYTKDQQDYISRLTPGLTGVGSLIFRNEEKILAQSKYDFEFTHDKIITPYKGELEKWYFKNKTILLNFKVILLTIAGLFISNMQVMDFFSNLPEKPKELKNLIN
ncbi:MAG: sugar transferase [Spirochaetes bacterium]|nr:sugar transferase [Syntrophaceae bacterium]MBN2771540.1 sugar transferase [Spirochaetota bacterium]